MVAGGDFSKITGIKTMSRLSSWWGSLVVFLLASLFLACILQRALPAFPVVSDSLDYQNIAQGLIDHHTYLDISNDHIIYPPGYPIFLAVLFGIQGHVGYVLVYFVQTLFVGLTAWLVFQLLNSLTKKDRVRWLGAIITLFWPYLLLYSHIVGSEALYIPLLIGSVTAAAYAIRTQSWKWTLLSGLLFGCTILTRPVALFLPIGLLIFLATMMALRYISQNYESLKQLGVIVLLSFVFIAPWSIAVSWSKGYVIPVASNLSFVFKKANTSLAYLPEYAKNTTNSITTKDVIRAKLRNFILFWDPGAGGENVDILAKRYPLVFAAVLVYKIGYFVLLGLALVGAWIHRKNLTNLVIVGTIGYFWAVHTVLFPFPRYTLPVIPLILVLAVSGLTCLFPYAFSSFDLHSGKK